MPDSIVLIPKDLSVLRRDEIRRRNAVGSPSLGEIVHGRRVTFTRVVNQAEMNAHRALTMKVEVRAHKIGSVMMFKCGVWTSVVEWPIQSTRIPWSRGSAGARYGCESKRAGQFFFLVLNSHATLTSCHNE
jgi:hypothetical protein